ncbi:MAG: S8 family serine peptidase [Candidatus Riflebacteria bacterium]|nr:S8 family serine peptidase [Candidatus Riflebacteria bacterium]
MNRSSATPTTGLAALLLALVFMATAPMALADGGPAGQRRLTMRRAFFGQLETRMRGNPDRMVEVLVRVKTAHSARALVDEGPLPEGLETRKLAVATACRSVVDGLAAIDRSPMQVLPGLPSEPTVLNTFWAARCVHLRVPASSLPMLLSRPDVDGVFEDVTLQALPPGEHTRVQGLFAASGDGWGQNQIRSAQARQQFRVDGTGVVLGQIDTGIDATHPALAGRVLRFRDFINGRMAPYDDQGHGTHTAGTMVGAGGMGVAPGARLVVAKALDARGGGSLSRLLAAMHWMLDPDGDPRTADQPVAVNNSWGVDRSEIEAEGHETTLFWETIRAWRSAGIVPVFAAGNTGTGRTLIPGSYPTNLAVAATDPADRVTAFSGSGRIDWIGWAFYKPDLAAPGLDIRSAAPGGGVAVKSGTSMATPHVTGLIALQAQLAPRMAVRDRELMLLDGCVDIGDPGRGQRSGEGRIDAIKALSLTSNFRPSPRSSGEYAPVFMRARRFRVSR